MVHLHRKWLLAGADNIEDTQIFSGGACNIISSTNELLRNRERDAINNWLTEQKILFFDPQIHPETHGCEYDYHVHYPQELSARNAAKIRLYEVSPRSFGGVTSFEIAMDHFHWREPMVIYYSDGDPENDIIPSFSPKGHPLFVPDGLKSGNESTLKAHYKEFIKNANNMRKYMMGLAREMDTLTIAFSDKPAVGDIVITPNRMHATDLFRAAVKAASNERVYVTFIGVDDQPEARDKRGNPLFLAPQNPPEVQMHALLDQYVDEGNELRGAIAELINISVFVRVVYTQKSATLALEELMRTEKVI